MKLSERLRQELKIHDADAVFRNYVVEECAERVEALEERLRQLSDKMSRVPVEILTEHGSAAPWVWLKGARDELDDVMNGGDS